MSRPTRVERTNPSGFHPSGDRRAKTRPRVPPPPLAQLRRESGGRDINVRTEETGLEGEPCSSHGTGHHDRGAAGREVLHRDLADATFLQVPYDLREALEEVHPEAVVLHPMELGRDLRVPLERDDEGSDLVVLPVPDLVPVEGVRLQPVEFRADRLHRLREVRGVHARGDRPHPSPGARIEAREGGVGETLLVTPVAPEPTV